MYRNAVQHVRASRLTDAELLYSPSQIALASFSLASPNVATSWARAKGAEPTLAVIEHIKEMIHAEGTAPDVERVRDVDRRLRLCKNPEKVVGSKAYLAKQAADDAKEKEKRTRKAEEVKRVLDANDPFGERIGDVATLDDDD